MTMKKIEYNQALKPENKNTHGMDPSVTGYDFGIPGLAVRKVGGFWQIDHVQSGYRAFSNLHRTRKECVGAALRAQSNGPIDWACDKEVILGKHLEDAIWHWKNEFLGHSRKPEFSTKLVCHGWSMRDLEIMLTYGRVEGLCGACGEVSDPHEPDARANCCPCCGEKKVTSALVLAGLI